jgi:hypothetical protein
MRYEVGATRVQDRVRSFMEDPWSSLKQFNESLEWDEVLGTPPDLSGQAFKKNTDEYSQYDRFDSIPAGEVRSTSSGNGLFFRKGEIEQVLEDSVNWEAVRGLFGALEFVGYQVKAQLTYNPLDPRNRILTGISIEIPEQDGMEAHTVNIHATNPQVSIECGFQQDEDKWIDRKKRQAQEQILELTRDLEPIEYSIEL